MVSYESYLRELGHTASNVITEKIEPLKEKKKTLLVEIEKRKQENDKLSADVKKQSDENAEFRRKHG
jgi:hypothetical protein